MEKGCKTITDYAIKHFHFSNLKRPLVIKVKCRTEICNGGKLTCLQFLFSQLAITRITGKSDGLIASALDSGSSGPASSLGPRDIVLCSDWARDLLSQCLSPSNCINGTDEFHVVGGEGGGKPSMD